MLEKMPTWTKFQKSKMAGSLVSNILQKASVLDERVIDENINVRHIYTAGLFNLFVLCNVRASIFGNT